MGNATRAHLTLVVLAFASGALAQDRESVTDFGTWYMYFGDHPFGDGGLGFHFDGQWRVEDFGQRRKQLLLRPGLNWDVDDTVQLSGGYAFIDTLPRDETLAGFNVPEHRLWQQLILRQRVGRTGLVHRYRLEQRFIGNKVLGDTGDGVLDGYDYKNRVRYFLKGTVPIGAATRYSFAFYNEVMVSFGENVRNNIFDQNRSYAALGIDVGRAGRIELGYLLQIVQRSTGDVIEYNHFIQIGFFSGIRIGG